MVKKYNRNFEWVSQDGRSTKVKDLTKNHLFRLIPYVEQRCLTMPFFKKEYDGFGDFLRTEVELRNLVNEFEKVMGRTLYLKPDLIDADIEITSEMNKIAELLGKYLFKSEEAIKKN